MLSKPTKRGSILTPTTNPTKPLWQMPTNSSITGPKVIPQQRFHWSLKRYLCLPFVHLCQDGEEILKLRYEDDYITLDNLFIIQIFYEENSPVDAQFGRLSWNIAEAHRDKENSLRERIDKEGARVRIKKIRHRKK